MAKLCQPSVASLGSCSGLPGQEEPFPPAAEQSQTPEYRK